MDIEVEIRSFITEHKYREMLDFFRSNAKFVNEDSQETHYLDENGDIRIQRNKFYSKIWIKKGKLHDEQREELEIRLGTDEFGKLELLFSTLGYKTHIKWFRTRHTFEWEHISVMLDHTKGYGYIIELEKMSNEEGKDDALKLLKSKMASLNVVQTPREEFESKYRDYSRNWQKLVEE